MGWRINLLLIDKKYEKPFTELTKELGLGESEIIEAPPQERFPFNVYHPEICMGHYQDKTLLTYFEFIDFFEKEPPALEQRLCQLFNDCQMVLLSYRENEGDQGFMVFNKGKRIRAKFIEEYEGTILDIGPKLKEEKGHPFSEVWYLLSKRILGKVINFWDVEPPEDELELDIVDMYTLKIIYLEG
jgi:hypothetical protein